MTDIMPSSIIPQCQFFVVRKKRLCRMTVKPGRQYCGEHEPQPKTEDGKDDTRIPCPNDPKHTCYISKLEKHLSVCNARRVQPPPYIEHNINAPVATDACVRRPLNEYPKEMLMQVIDKVNALYDKYLKDTITEVPENGIHPVVAADMGAESRGESSRRHLRQASSLLLLAERAGLVTPNTCYVELGAGKGQLSYYMGSAWCGPPSGSRVLAVDRAALRHKRDNKLRAAPPAQDPSDDPARSDPAPRDSPGIASRVRADLAHLALHRVPDVVESTAVVGFAKHLCGIATDYALRCMTSAGDKSRGLVLATCCHHRCELVGYLGRAHLQELGISDEELNIMLGIVSWATCGDGRSRARRREGAAGGGGQGGEREGAGRRAKALLDWGRALFLQSLGWSARLTTYVPLHVSPENLCIIASRDPASPLH